MDGMMRYYFDLRDGDEFARDEEGIDLRNIKQVEKEATKSLVDLARDAIRSFNVGGSRRIEIEVRNDDGPVLQARLSFAISKASAAAS
jgi:hypothetical protein